LDRQQANVVQELREYQPVGDDDIDRQWRGQLRDSFAALATQRKDLDTQLDSLTEEPGAPGATDVRLLDELPIMRADLSRVPEDLERELFAAFQLQLRYHHPTRGVTLRVTIDGQALPRLLATGQAIGRSTGTATGTPTEKSPAALGTRAVFPLQ
jgi:site-specific DNA recombinase